MRYLGNKSKLLETIEEFARERGIDGRRFTDCFAGTAVVGAHFKRRGYAVLSCDLLMASYVSQVAAIEVSESPAFQALLAHGPVRKALNRGAVEAALQALPPETPEALARAIAVLQAGVEDREGLIFRHYAPSGLHARRYFQDRHARKIDGCLHQLRSWFRRGIIERGELCLLLKSVLDASDRVANIAGVYAAYLKGWQHNTRGALALRPPPIIPGPRGQARRASAEQAAAEPCDVLYIDPPYNSRQYAAYYHVREVIAEHHNIRDLKAYEARLYGKTGMRPYSEEKSAYCSRRRRADGLRVCEGAFQDLIAGARARHIIVSYNEEGIIDRDIICGALARYAGKESFDLERDHKAVRYKRFRSDADGRGGRTYKVLEGKHPNQVDEWLFYARSDRRF